MPMVETIKNLTLFVFNNSINKTTSPIFIGNKKLL